MSNLINRREAIDAICKHFNYDENDDFVYWNREHVLRVLRDLPPAQIEQNAYEQGRITGRVEMRTEILSALKNMVGSEVWNNV